MEKTWRWFGPGDKITLGMLRQIGVEGIVTALHPIPNGEVWPAAEIETVKKQIEAAGLRWSVVESLPVSEPIKYGGPQRERLIANYIESLENLGRAGIRTVCYNFMPVIDWIRTDLERPLGDGTSTLWFDSARFAYFDLRILRRQGAEADYTASELEKVEALERSMTVAEKDALVDTIIVKTQGFVNGNVDGSDPVGAFRRLLALYEGIDRQALLSNLVYFLERIMPVCNRYGIGMCIHPDDPPRQVLGLPRIVTGRQDIERILRAVDDPCNGLTFCAGSLSSGLHNDPVELARTFAPRVKFVHLRSTEVFNNGDFTEAPHLEGRGQLIELVRIFERLDPQLPMRVDHGRLMLGDTGHNPGYSFHGRMFALAQMEGVMATVRNEIANKMI